MGVIGSLALPDVSVMSVILVFSASASTSDSLVGAEPEPLPVTHLGSRVVLKYEEGLLKDGGSRLKVRVQDPDRLGFTLPLLLAAV